jgi:hypothetical protein
MVPSRGSRTARSRGEISVGWSPALAASCSWDSFAAARYRLRFAANRSSGLTRGILTGPPAEALARLLEELAARREAMAEATPGPERVYSTDGYSRALLM